MNARRDELVALDRRHVWRPYTSTDQHQGTDPLVVVAAEGAWLHDADGRKYLDANGSWWVHTLGHGHPRLRRVLRERADLLHHCSLAGVTHPEAALLARDLAAAAPPGLDRVFFSDDGSTAVEVAVKIAFQYWQQNGQPERRRFLSFAGAYHGDTLGAVSLGGVPAFRSVFGPLLFDVLQPEAIGLACELLAREGGEIAGVIVEPILQGAAGMLLCPPALLRDLRAATESAGTFLIADEVFTGYGRTAAMWACELAGITPDLLCIAKGFTGGVLPMAATLATARVYDGFRGGRDRALMHGHSFCGNPIGAAVAREVLAIYRDEDVVGQARRKAPRIHRAFSERIAALPGVLRTRAIGMVGAADLGTGGYAGAAGWRVHDAARERGVYLRPLGDTVYIAPPLDIPDADLDLLLDRVADSIAAAHV